MARLSHFLALFLALSPAAGWGCTTISLTKSPEKVMAKSLDWDQNHGYALINLRNLKKTALVLDPRELPAQWTSKYGSLSFNQHGREFPLGGLNEKGLTVEIMWLDTSIYPDRDKTPVVNELQWIQFQLDLAATASEAIALAKTIRVVPNVAKVHYLVCDANADCATFEYINKKLVIHEGAQFPVRTLTNDTYDDSLKFLSQILGFGGTKPAPAGTGSLERFSRAATLVKAYDPVQVKDAVEYAFQILQNVEQPNYTTWNLVYESAGHRVHYRTQNMPRIKEVDTSKFNYSCKEKPQFIDMKSTTCNCSDVTGDFAPFEGSDNLKLVKLGLANFLNELPQGTAELVAQYPDSLKCME